MASSPHDRELARGDLYSDDCPLMDGTYCPNDGDCETCRADINQLVRQRHQDQLADTYGD